MPNARINVPLNENPNQVRRVVIELELEGVEKSRHFRGMIRRVVIAVLYFKTVDL